MIGYTEIEELSTKTKAVIKKFSLMLQKIRLSRAAGFVGIGLLVYDSKLLLSSCCSSLRPSYIIPQNLTMDQDWTVNFLVGLSTVDHPLHDGFHFFNEEGKLTHVSQYFVPKIIEGIEINEKYGTRYRSAQYGSCMEGIIVIGMVHQDGQIHCLYKGNDLVTI